MNFILLLRWLSTEENWRGRFKENETWYGTTLRSIGEAVISTDTLGTIKFMNTAAENLTGWKMNEVTWRRFAESILDDRKNN